MIFSVNNRLVLEPYIKEGLKSKVSGGIAIPGQRDGLKGLLVLMDTRLSDDREIPKGSTAYLREETLHTQAFASKPLSCAILPNKFIIVDIQFIEFFDILESQPDDAA